MKNIEINSTSIIIILGTIQGIILSIAIAANKTKKKESRFLLTLFILSFSLVGIEDFLFESGYIFKYPYFIDTFSGLILALPPTLYLYVKSEISFKKIITYKSLLHYLPVAILLFFIIIGLFEPQTIKIQTIIKYKSENSFSFNESILISIIQTFIYIILIIVSLNNYRVQLKDEYSNTHNNKVLRLLYHVYFFLILFVIWIFAWYMSSTFLINSINIAFVIFVYLFGYLGYQNENKKLTITNSDDFPEISKKRKYEKSTLTENDKEMICNKLKEFIKNEKPYLNPELNLTSLANSLYIQPHKLSQVLNESFNMSFYDLINLYRVNEVIQKLSVQESNKYKILTIAYDSGFNSKVTFYSAFQKHIGKSPSTYRRENNHKI